MAPEALLALLQRSNRDHVPLRRSFLQSRQRGGGAAPLSHFVTARRDLALDLLLLTHALGSAPPWDVCLPSEAWCRALDLQPSKSNRVRLSNNWRWLEELQLIRRGKRGRLQAVQLLSEDGSGLDYTHPGDTDATPVVGDYFKVPNALWLAADAQDLDISARAILLIAFSSQPGFILPIEKAPKWYGISVGSAQRGLATLTARGLLSHRQRFKRAPLAPKGISYDRLFYLEGPFAHLHPKPQSLPEGVIDIGSDLSTHP